MRWFKVLQGRERELWGVRNSTNIQIDILFNLFELILQKYETKIPDNQYRVVQYKNNIVYRTNNS